MFEDLTIVNFTPTSAFLGGLLIGLAALWMLLLQGRVAGISGMCGTLMARGGRSERGWKTAFIAGLVVAGVVAAKLPGLEMSYGLSRSTVAIAVAGLLVGFGTRLGSGCTSGHGVCGLGRFSLRSAAATGTFMGVGMATAALVTHVFGGAL